MTSTQEIIEALSAIEQDTDVPKNIRTKISEMIMTLGNTAEDFELKIDQTIQRLDELSSDPNLPSFTRTQIWSVMSCMEGK